MDFDYSEEQEMLRTSARDFLEVEYPRTLVREMEEDELGYPPELWRKMANLGWMGLIIPEEYGGSGGDFLDLAILFEEMGRACMPSLFFSTVILGGLPIIISGTEGQKQELLPGVADGETMITMALVEPSGRYEADSIATRAIMENNEFVVTGTKLFVPDAHVADYILCVARSKEDDTPEGGISVILLDGRSPGIEYTNLRTIASDKQLELVFNGARSPRDRILGEPNEGWSVVKKVLEFASVAKCAELVGGLQRVLEMATEYAKERQQFGQLIGSFQAIKHHCANILIDVDGARLITYEAAWRLANSLPASKEASMAKAWVSEISHRVTLLGHEIFGGIGFTRDHDMQLYYRRAKAAALNFGDADFHRELVARQLWN